MIKPDALHHTGKILQAIGSSSLQVGGAVPVPPHTAVPCMCHLACCTASFGAHHPSRHRHMPPPTPHCADFKPAHAAAFAL